MSEFLLAQLSTREVEFIAQNEPVKVFPATTLGTLHLISDDYGPLRTNQASSVPLWLACQLKKSRQCRIVPPPWMEVGWLEQRVREEVERREDFTPLPFHYLEIATAILECAAEDVAAAEQVRILIQKLREQRMAKIRLGLSLLDGNPLKLNNLGHLELNEVRPFLLGALGVFCEIGAAEEAEHLARSRHYSSSHPPDLSPSSSGGGNALFPLNPLGSSQFEANK